MAKGSKARKPVSARKAFKKTAQYVKPRTVGATEEAGSKYRQKLRRRQQELLGPN